jgi:CrcB protein
MKRLTEFLYIGCGGFLGAVSRFYVSGVAHRVLKGGFPYGTLIVNATGSFLLGFISFLALHRQILGQNIKLAVTVGFLGAFTTFSTFSYETFNLMKEGSYYLSAVNIITNLMLCLAMVFLGVSVAALIDKVF